MLKVGEDVLEAGCDLVEATSLHRPDTSWVFMDAAGHEHRWFSGARPAQSYTPSETYETPSLVWVHDGWGYYEDGERYELGHRECATCGERIEPRYTSDTVRQYVPGLRWFRINGMSVSREEFEQRVAHLR